MDKILSGSRASDILKGTPNSAGKSCGAERAWYHEDDEIEDERNNIFIRE